MSTATATSSTAKNTDIYGEVINWAIDGDRLSTLSEIQAALVSAGFTADYAQELSPRQAFSRAAKHLREQRLIEKLDIQKEIARFQLTKKELAAGLLRYDYECLVSLNIANGDIECVEDAEIERKARELFAHARTVRTASDVARVVQRLFASQPSLMSIHPRKRVPYLVPARFHDFTLQVDQFLEPLGGELVRFPVPKGSRANTGVRDAVNSGLNGLLTQLETAVAGFNDKTRKTTIERSLAQLDEVGFKIEAYESFLASSQSKLAARLKAAKAEAAGLLTTEAEESAEETGDQDSGDQDEE